MPCVHVCFTNAVVYVPQRSYFIAKDAIANTPFIGKCLIKGGHLKIDRADLKSAIGTLGVAAKKMKAENKCICIAPEGTRRRTKSIDSGEHLLPFKKGPFHLAKDAECDIVFLTWQGVHRLTSQMLVKPGTFKLTIGGRIDKAEVTRLPVDELMDKARKVMIGQMKPMPDSEVFKVQVSRLPWLIFVLVHLFMYIVVCRLFR